MIAIRSIVKFKANNRDKAKYIVREIRMGGKALVQSLELNDEYYIVPVDDLEVVECD